MFLLDEENKSRFRTHVFSLTLAFAITVFLNSYCFDSSSTISISVFLNDIAVSLSKVSSISLLFIFIFISAVIIFVVNRLDKIKRRKFIFLSVGSFIVACSIAFSNQVALDGCPSSISLGLSILTSGTRGYFYLYLVLKFVALYIAVLFLCLAMNLSFPLFDRHVLRGLFLMGLSSRLTFSFRSIAAYSSIIFLIWLPIFYINGPVIIGMDTMVQLIQVKGFPAWDPMMMTSLDGYSITDHHPVFDSFIYWLFDTLGVHLGSELFGLVACTLLWGFLAVVALVISICWLRKRTSLSDGVVSLLLLFIALIPTFSSYMTTIVKDTTWIPFYICWNVIYFEIIYRLSKKDSLNFGLIVGFFVFSLIAGLTKKTSIYITLLSALALIYFGAKGLRLFFIELSAAIIIIFLIPSFVFPIFRVARGGGQEMLGTPIQQITYILKYHPQSISDSDLDTINSVFDWKKAVAEIDLSNVDYVKHSYRSNCTTSEKIHFLIVWIKIGISHPISYLKAVPFLSDYFLLGNTYYWNGPVKLGWEQSGGYAVLPDFADGEMSWQQSHISVPYIQLMKTLPCVSIFSSEVLFTLWIPLFVILLILYRSRPKRLLYLVPVFSTYLTMLMLPTYQTRYTLSFLFAFALNLSIPFICQGEFFQKDEESLNSDSAAYI